MYICPNVAWPLGVQNRLVCEAIFLIEILNAHSTAPTYLSQGILN